MEEHHDFFSREFNKKKYEVYDFIEPMPDNKIREKHNLTLQVDFPINLHCNQYLFVLYDYNSNTILDKPMKTRQGKEIAKSFTSCYKCLTKHGHEVKVFVLNNNCSNNLKLVIIKIDTKYELVPPPPIFTDVMRYITPFVRLRITWLCTCLIRMQLSIV